MSSGRGKTLQQSQQQQLPTPPLVPQYPTLRRWGSVLDFSIELDSPIFCFPSGSDGWQIGHCHLPGRDKPIYRTGQILRIDALMQGRMSSALRGYGGACLARAGSVPKGLSCPKSSRQSAISPSASHCSVTFYLASHTGRVWLTARCLVHSEPRMASELSRRDTVCVLVFACLPNWEPSPTLFHHAPTLRLSRGERNMAEKRYSSVLVEMCRNISPSHGQLPLARQQICTSLDLSQPATPHTRSGMFRPHPIEKRRSCAVVNRSVGSLYSRVCDK